MDRWDIEVKNLDFLSDSEKKEKPPETNGSYTILIADDDEQVHKVTKMILRDFEYNHRSLEFIDTYSGAETIEVLKKHDDIAILFLDVVMEKNNSGFEVVEYLRGTMKNYITRIILRTGQPGEAPEEEVIRDYDINDYLLKSELSSKRLFTSLYSSIRSYRDLVVLKRNQQGLQKIIKMSSELFNKNSLDDFLVSILEQISTLTDDSSDMIYLRNEDFQNGFVSMRQSNKSKIVAATGSYKKHMGMDVEDIPELSFILEHLKQSEIEKNGLIRKIDKGILVYGKENSTSNNVIFLEGPKEGFDFNLINLFLTHFSITLDNFILNNLVSDTQKEILFALAETVEAQSEDTGTHIERISKMMYEFALIMHMSYQEAELIRLASTMHDLGKIAVPDAVLKKPAKLNPEEFEVIKTHCDQGYRILSRSQLPVMKMAAEIALSHHEKFDGSGYPKGVMGKSIPTAARMMAIVDVFDALTHKRVYKEAFEVSFAIDVLIEGKGKHFDGDLVDLFVSRLDDIMVL
ncbi:DUF3369 domain-containing protein [Eubacteriaceae bacterium ES3]|nr:DUF3369 domain-containing protein [Eubacteriaceae bacterium ES3]